MYMCPRWTSAALDAHCAGLRSALAGLEARAAHSHHADEEQALGPCAEAGGANGGVSSVLRRGEMSRIEEGWRTARVEDKKGVLSVLSEPIDQKEKPRHNECFSPLPTQSPSVDRLAIEMGEISLMSPSPQHYLPHAPLVTVPSAAAASSAASAAAPPQAAACTSAQQHTQQRPKQHLKHQQWTNRHQLTTSPGHHANDTHAQAPTVTARHDRRCPQASRPHPVTSSMRSPGVEYVVGVFALAAGVMGRLFAAPHVWGTAVLAVVNLSAGVFLALRCLIYIR